VIGQRPAPGELGSGIVEILIRGAKGEMLTERTPDGLQIVVRIPVNTRDDSPQAPRAMPDRARGGALSGRKVLVLEDEALIALELQSALEEAGASVELAMTADNALSLIEQHAFDAAVLDVNLGQNTTCATVAARPRSSKAPFVLHSGDLRRHGELVETLAAPVVPKPAPASEITRRLAALLHD
jgi:CheY-like chemotaxis protein